MKRSERRLPATSSSRALYSGISRGTEALVFEGRVPPSEHAPHAGALSAGRVSGAREVRLFHGRTRRARARRADRPYGVRAPSRIKPASSSLPSAFTWCRMARSRIAGRAGREPRNGAQRSMGCEPASWRSYRGDWRWDCRLPGRMACRTNSRLRRRADRHQSPPRVGRRCAQRAIRRADRPPPAMRTS